MGLEQNVIDLEIKLAHQEHVIEALNHQVYEQQKQLSRLELAFDRVMKRLESMAQADAPEPGNEPPPHY